MWANVKAAMLALVLFAPGTLLQSETAVVTGRLLSADGTGAPTVRVMAVHVAEGGLDGAEIEVIEAISETDASGKYRLENLAPGRYYIRAGFVDNPTYYPGVTTPGEARVVTLSRGTVESGVDFRLRLGVGVKISGRVIFDPRQKPSTGLQHISLARGAPFVDEVPIKDDGTFEFTRVAPGSYSVVIRGVAAVRAIQVGERDVKGIELNVPLRYEVPARMVVERNGPLPNRPVGVFFEGSDRRGSQAQFLSDAPIKVLFLEDSYNAMPNDVPPGYTITSIQRGSLDLMKDPLKIPSNETSDIVVTIRAQP
jgi:Carboxypeptidase regulatory-like domain